MSDLKHSIGDLGRALAMLLVLRPAADYLPRSMALWLADHVAFALGAISSGARAFHGELQATFGGDAARARWLAREIFALPLRDFVMLRRIVAGREDAWRWPVEERIPDAVRELRASGASYIIALGHFARRAIWSVHLPQVTPQRPLVVVNPRPRLSINPQGLRWYLQYGLMLDTLERLRPDLELYYVKRDAADTLVQKLRTPGNAVTIHADAPWPFRRGAIERPFAAFGARSFATGVAKVARLAQCPIVACVSTFSRDGVTLLEWTEPIAPGSIDDAGSDARVTSTVLDALEVGIGRHPDQYVLDIGNGRKWNAEAATWESEGTSPAPEPVEAKPEPVGEKPQPA